MNLHEAGSEAGSFAPDAAGALVDNVLSTGGTLWIELAHEHLPSAR